MSNYVQSLLLADHVYRLFLDSVKNTLKHFNIEDINSVQAVMLYNIGEECVTVGDLIRRKYYLGANVTYNLKKMLEAGYVEQVQPSYDGRSKSIFLTQKGQELCKRLDHTFKKQLKTTKQEELDDLSDLLKKLKTGLVVQNYGVMAK